MKPQRIHPPKRIGRGMTLPELMMTMAVFAMLLFFVLPFYVSMLKLAGKTSGVLFNTDALRSFSTQFSGDVQGATTFRLITDSGEQLPTIDDSGSNHLRLTYSDPRTGSVLRLVGYYLDTSAGGTGPWPVRRYQVNGSVGPNLALESVRKSHPTQARVNPVTTGQLFQSLANQRTVFVNANVITPGDNANSKAINSLRLAIGLR